MEERREVTLELLCDDVFLEFLDNELFIDVANLHNAIDVAVDIVFEYVADMHMHAFP